MSSLESSHSFKRSDLENETDDSQSEGKLSWKVLSKDSKSEEYLRAKNREEAEMQGQEEGLARHNEKSVSIMSEYIFCLCGKIRGFIF